MRITSKVETIIQAVSPLLGTRVGAAGAPSEATATAASRQRATVPILRRRPTEPSALAATGGRRCRLRMDQRADTEHAPAQDNGG